MITRDGRVFFEKDYEGYGVFGGKDYYELVAELNGKGNDRRAGIDICFTANSRGDCDGSFQAPKLVERLKIDLRYFSDDQEKQQFATWFDSLDYPTNCEFQGFFYPSDEDREFNENYDDDYEY